MLGSKLYGLQKKPSFRELCPFMPAPIGWTSVSGHLSAAWMASGQFPAPFCDCLQSIPRGVLTLSSRDVLLPCDWEHLSGHRHGFLFPQSHPTCGLVPSREQGWGCASKNAASFLTNRKWVPYSLLCKPLTMEHARKLWLCFLICLAFHDISTPRAGLCLSFPWRIFSAHTGVLKCSECSRNTLNNGWVNEWMKNLCLSVLWD